MSVAAVMLVRDEADIIRFTLEHLLRQVDHVYVAENLSKDATREIACSFDRVTVIPDDELGYWQSKKTTALAMRALADGHEWVVPCDADEFWYANERTVSSLLNGLSPDVQIVTAPLFNHLPTDEDDPTEMNPFLRMGWRKREAGALPKVACRARPDLVIHAGNHSASTAGSALRSGGLLIRHFSWRSAEQYVRKIRNGEQAYAATTLPSHTGEHWRMWEGHPDEALVDHFNLWFHSAKPREDDTLIYDPAPRYDPVA